MIDGSFITNLPDAWALNQRWPLLAINHWTKNIAGFSWRHDLRQPGLL